MGWSYYHNFAIQVFIPSRNVWRVICYLQLEDVKGKVWRYHMFDHGNFFDNATKLEWDQQEHSAPVEGYPLILDHGDFEYCTTSQDSDREDYVPCSRDEYIRESDYNVLQHGSGELFAICDENEFTPPRRDEFPGVDGDESYSGWMDHDYKYLQTLLAHAKVLQYVPSYQILAHEIPVDIKSLDAGPEDWWYPWRKETRIQVIQQSLTTLFSPLLPESFVVMNIVPFLVPPLQQVRIHYSQGCDG